MKLLVQIMFWVWAAGGAILVLSLGLSNYPRKREITRIDDALRALFLFAFSVVAAIIL